MGSRTRCILWVRVWGRLKRASVWGLFTFIVMTGGAYTVPEGMAAASNEPALAATPVRLANMEVPPEAHERMLWSVFLIAGGGFGGDDVATVEFTDGSEKTITAGGGAIIALGTAVNVYSAGPHSLTIALDLGGRLNSVSGLNADLTMRRFAMAARGRYSYRLIPRLDLFVGLGPQYETGVRIEGSGDFSAVDARLEPALGALFDIGVLLDMGSIGTEFALRYLRIGYSADAGTDSLDGSAIGFVFSLHWAPITGVGWRQ